MDEKVAFDAVGVAAAQREDECPSHVVSSLVMVEAQGSGSD